MAERRMFAKSVIVSDNFMNMPFSAQTLYFHLAIMADDDGFLNNAKMIMRMTGSAEEDLETLADNNFIIKFESGVVVITHWKVHNYIRSDRYKETLCQTEKSQLYLNESKTYCFGIPDDNQKTTQDNTGKDSTDKDKYIQSHKTAVKRNVKPSKFNNFYQAPPDFEAIRESKRQKIVDAVKQLQR